MNLRPYQLKILSAVREGWKQFRKQFVVSPQGSGKTVVFSHQTKECVDSGGRVLILVDQDELVWQALDKLKGSTGIEGQPEKAEHRAALTSPVVVATIQSMIRRLENWPKDHFAMIIVDECDKSVSPSWQAVLKHFDGSAKVCGFTATPNRTDEKSLGVYYENVAIEVGLVDMIKQGFLSPIQIKMLPITIDLNSVKLTSGDFDKDELDSVITPYFLEVANAIKIHAANRKTLVFLPLIKSSMAFTEICKSVGLLAEHIDGTSDDRKEKLKRFANGEFQVMSNSSLLTRGYDDPSISCVVMLRPTKSVTLYQQAIGRGTRIAEGKKDLLILDFLFQSERHFVCRPASLIAKTDDEAESITEITERDSAMPSDVVEQFDLLQVAQQASSEREDSLRKKLEAMADRKSKFISAEEFAVRNHKLEIAEFEPTMKWHGEPITDKQTPWLEKAGVNIDTVKGKGHASAILDVYFNNLKKQPASAKQKWTMKQAGWVSEDGTRNADAATQEEARRFFNGRNN